MPADWIKMRTDLYRDPKVIGMANALRHGDVTPNVTRYIRCSVVGALVSVWGVLRHQGERRGDDLCIPKCKLTVIDDIADLPGFGEAMASVGWANETPDGVVLPKFFRDLNAEPVRSGAAERQKRYRERQRDGSVTRDAQRDVTQPVTVTGEKRESREERNTPQPPDGGGVSKSKTAKAEHTHFAAFWTAYPRKTAKPAASTAFARIDPDDATFAAMLAALDRQRRSADWCKDGGRFIPHPATWLNQRRWEDQLPEVSKPQTPERVYDVI